MNRSKPVKTEKVVEKLFKRTIKKRRVFATTRKDFWKLLIKEGILTNVQEYVQVASDDTLVGEKISERRVTKLELDWSKCIIFNPSYDLRRMVDPKEEESKKWVLFKKEDVKEHCGGNYRRLKTTMISNRVAVLDRQKLATMSFGQVVKEDLEEKGIPSEDWDELWEALVDQKVLTETGQLGPTSITQFYCQHCPQYDDAIQYLLSNKFAWEIARRKLLNVDEESTSALNRLPINPYADLLADLLAGGIVVAHQVAHVTGDFESLLEKNKIPEKDAKLIASYLKGNRPALSDLETPDASLSHIREALKSVQGIATEEYVFGLNNFDDFIQIGDQRWSWKMIGRSFFVIALGIGQLFAGAYTDIQSFGLMTQVGSGLISEALFDLSYGLSALYSGQNFSWTDYAKFKRENMFKTAAFCGIGACLSRGKSALEIGLKFGQAAKAATKTALIIGGTSVSLVLVFNGVQSLVDKYLTSFLTSFFSKIREKLTGDIEAAVHKHPIGETLVTLYRKYGREEAKHRVTELMGQVMSGDGLMNKLVQTICSMFMSSIGPALAKTRLTANAKLIATKVLGVVTTVTEALANVEHVRGMLNRNMQTLNANLEDLINSPMGQTRKLQVQDTEEEDKFKKEMLDQLSSATARQADGFVQQLTTSLLQQAAACVCTFAAQLVKSGYKQLQEKRLRDELLQEKKKPFSKYRSPAECPNSESVRDRLPRNYHETLLNLLKKTNSPELIAEIVREGVPADRTCVDAVSVGLSRVLKE